MKSLLESIRSSSISESILSSTGTGRSAIEVDLGLSVNWCSCNVGASKPEEAGLYFAWGDTRGYKKSEIGGDMFSSRWYSKLPASRIKGKLKLKDDAAHVYMKGNWRIPNLEEIQELLINTTTATEQLNGVKGTRFTSNKNGNSIFIPFSGGARYGSVDYFGHYFCWSNSTNPDDKSSAYYLSGDYIGNVYSGDYGTRCIGWNVRAVCGK